MEQIGFESIVITLIEKMSERGSWSSGTHLQKTMFFLQEMMGVHIDLEFVLYKHGPFSFDLQPKINSMLADNILNLQYRDPMYGPSLVKGSNAEVVTRQSQDIINEHLSKIEFIAEKFSSKNVAELERVGTAYFVFKENSDQNEDTIIKEIHESKPHITIDQARSALTEVKAILNDAQALL